MSQFQKYAASTSVELHKVLENNLSNWAKTVNPSLKKHAHLFVERNFGGKMLRGCLVKLGYEIASGKGNREVLKAAAAIEIFQTSILAHDDVIDMSPTRRGKSTIYKALGGDHYAISQTICLGDIGFFIAARILTDSKFEAERKVKALSFFSDMVVQTGLGEMLDVELPRIPKNRTEEAVLEIHRLKTAYYTFIYPLSIGAVLGGAKKTLLNHFKDFGLNLGLAFQIQDDILGVFGDEEKLGKSVTSDIVEGKNTLLITEARKHATPKHLKILDDFYGKGEITDREHEMIKKVFIETGSLDYSKKKIVEYVEKAKATIKNITEDKKCSNLLLGLADFLVTREK